MLSESALDQFVENDRRVKQRVFRVLLSDYPPGARCPEELAGHVRTLSHDLEA